MANPFGEKNIGPWEGQQVEYIPLDDLVLWTENPRDPLDGDYTNDDVIRRATDGRNDKQWQLSKLSKEMGDRFDLSELPTVCRIDDGPKYRVYDGNRRVILAMLRKAGLTTEGQQQLVPPDFPDPTPCNVCDEETALENVERKHRGNGSWKQYERDRFMFDYRGGPKTVLIRLEELIKAVTKWPALGMARDSALSALSTLPDVVACVASPRTDAGKKISCGRHDAQERQRHKAADGEQRHQIVVPGGGQVQDDFEDVEHGLDQVSDVFHVPWYAFAGHVYARSRFW